MKISTLLLGGAFLMNASVMAQNPNLMENANKGATGDKGAMAQNGWECWKFPFTYDEINEEITVSDPEQMTWDASGPGGNNVRWENKGASVKYEGNTYNGNVAFIRWDNGSIHSCWYVYPVEITTPGIYEFSMLAGEWSNCSADSDKSYLKTNGNEAAVMVAFSDKRGPEGIKWNLNVSDEDLAVSQIGLPGEGEGKLFILPKTANDFAELQKCTAEVDARNAGTYYVQFLGSHALDVMADFQLRLLQAFPDGSGVEEISSASVESVTYFGIDGTVLSNPAKGSLVIEKKTMSDGTVKTCKKIIR